MGCVQILVCERDVCTMYGRDVMHTNIHVRSNFLPKCYLLGANTLEYVHGGPVVDCREGRTDIFPCSFMQSVGTLNYGIDAAIIFISANFP